MKNGLKDGLPAARSKLKLRDDRIKALEQENFELRQINDFQKKLQKILGAEKAQKTPKKQKEKSSKPSTKK